MQTLSENPSNNFEINWEQFSYDYENPINEGKTKRVLKVLNDNWSENDEYVVIEEKDIVTAWDWARTESVEWKWKLTNNINSNYFEYLNDLWMKTAFIKKLDNNRTLVKKLDMIPVECVYRFVSTGSHQRREQYKAKSIEGYIPKEEWEILDEMIIDLYFKDDIITKDWLVISDPLIKLDENGVPEIDSNWKLILLNPDTEEVLDYTGIVKKSLWEIKDKEWKIVKHFKFWFKDWEFESRYIQDWNWMSFTEGANWNNYIVVYNADNWEDITENAKITPDMISVNTINEENKKTFKDIQDSSNHLTEETKKFGQWVKQLNDKVGLSTLDWKWEFWRNKNWEILFWDSLDADSNRIRKVFTVIWTDWKKYLAKDNFTNEELWESWKNFSFFKRLNVIPESIKVKKIGLAAGLDKEWFRQWESGKKLLKKIEKLSIHTTKAKEIHDEEIAYEINNTYSIVKSAIERWEITMNEAIEIHTKSVNRKTKDILWR